MASHTSSSLRIALAAILLPLVLVACAPTDGGTQTGSLLNGTGATGKGREDLLSMRAGTDIAEAGGAVSYTVTLRNRTPIDFKDAEVNVTFPGRKLRVTDTAGGTMADDRITWAVPSLPAGETMNLAYRGILSPELPRGELVRTVVSFRASNLSSPVTAQAEVRIGGGSGSGGLPSSSSSSSSDSGYTFFLGEEGSSSSALAVSPSSSGAADTPVPASLAVTYRPDAAERPAGGSVRYMLTVRNASAVPVRNVTVEALLPSALTVTEAGGGAKADDALTWSFPSLGANQSRTLAFRATLSRTVRPGDVVTTIGEVTTPALPAPLVATADVRIVAGAAPLPQSGAEDRFFRPVEDTSKYVRKVR
ncbi:MAG: hypothetical protein AAB728_04125 [Patescibacteria group bacterium]